MILEDKLKDIEQRFNEGARLIEEKNSSIANMQNQVQELVAEINRLQGEYRVVKELIENPEFNIDTIESEIIASE